MADCGTFYTLNIKLYVRTQPDGPLKQSNTPDEIMERFLSPTNQSNRNITTDKWYISVPLAEEILRECSLTMANTLHKNKPQIPKEFKPRKDREVNSCTFGLTDTCTVVLYVPKRNKAVILLTTMRHDAEVDKDTGVKKKPEKIIFYNLIKTCVNVVDNFVPHTSTEEECDAGHSLALLFSLLDAAALNARIHFNYSKLKGCKMSRCMFMKQMATEHDDDHVQNQAKLQSLPQSLKWKLTAVTVQADEAGPSQMPTTNTAGRYMFDGTEDHKSRIICVKCNLHVCKSHQKVVCSSCMEKLHFNTLKSSGNCMSHLFCQSTILQFEHRLYLWVLYDSLSKQRLFP
jgi:hypothetical protein